MIVSNKHKFIYFFTVGNTASRTVHKSLCKYHDDGMFTILNTDTWCTKNHSFFKDYYKDKDSVLENGGNVISREISPKFALELFKLQGRENIFWEYTKVATIRNPYSLIVGCAHKNFGKFLVNKDLYQLTLPTLASKLRAHGHDVYNLQNGQSCVFSIDGNYVLDHEIFFEQLAHNLKNFCDQKGIEAKLITDGYTNKNYNPEIFFNDIDNINDAYYTWSMTDYTIEQINIQFNKDFERYGYNRITPGWRPHRK